MPVLKSDFNKVAKQLYLKLTLALVFSCKYAVYFQNTFTLSEVRQITLEYAQ